MKFITLSEKEISTTYLSIRNPHLLISISNPGPDVAIPSTPYCKGILRLKFHDVEDVTTKEIFFDHNMGREILDFVDEGISNVNTIVVHCGAGLSRSIATASALSKIINYRDDDIFSKGIPNMMVYLTILSEYFNERQIRTKWSRIFYVRNENLKQLLNPMIYKILDYKVRKREEED